MDTPGYGSQLSHVDTCFTEHCYCLYLRTYDMDPVLHIDSPVFMCWLSLYSRYIEHRSCHMAYYYMSIHVFPLHDYFPLLDMWAIDMRCVESHFYCFPFLDILFHAINRAHVMLSCYMYHVLYLFLIYCVVKENKYNLGMGETWRLLDLIGWMY